VGENFLETVHRRVHEPAPGFATSLCIPPHLQQVVLACLETDPDRRPLKAASVATGIAGSTGGALGRSRRSFHVPVTAAGISSLVIICIIGLALLDYTRKFEHVPYRKKSGTVIVALPTDVRALQQRAVQAFADNDHGLAEIAFKKVADSDAAKSNKGWRAGALEYLALLHMLRQEMVQGQALTEEASELWRQQYGENSSYSAYGDITAGQRLLQMQKPVDAERHLDRAFETLLRCPKDNNYVQQQDSLINVYRTLYELDGRTELLKSKRKALADALVKGP
jgi:hypothetical protein